MFINIKKFKHASILTNNYSTILKEFKKFGEKKFHPWPCSKDAPEVIHDGKWLIRPLYGYGRFFKPAVRDYPQTTSLLKGLDHLNGAAFSFLPPKTHIYPHTGYNETKVIRVHLALTVPNRVRDGVISTKEDCWITVSGETKCWEEGKLLILDDTFEHEVQNNTEETRAVLILDFYEKAFDCF
jgi:beta-hydroxylase|tara:strand:- start:3236 stop:3784 length:549 start_codon:yes stop_codon:yes gene_type:complete